MQAERVIFRTYRDPYKSKDTPCFLAVFPDDEAGRGRIAATPFYFDGHEAVFFEPYTEMSERYYYNCTKIVHKGDFRIPLLLHELSQYYGGAEFRACEKR